MKKIIKIKCFDNGTAKLTTNALHLEGENLASVIQVDFSETAHKHANKILDIVNGKYKSRHLLGDGEIVEYALDYDNTTPGVMVITPIATDGERKVKYKVDYSLTITRQPDVTTDEKPGGAGDVLLEVSASSVTVEASNFSNLLSTNATNVQKALDELDKSTEAIDLESITNLFN